MQLRLAWRQIPGSVSQTLAYSSNAAAYATNVIGKQTYAILVQVIAADPTVPTGAIVAVGHAPNVASTTNGQLVKASDPPVIIGCAPGDSISALGLDVDGGELYITEVT